MSEENKSIKIQDNKNDNICTMCTQEDSNQYKYCFKLEGRIVYQSLCTNCHTKIMNTRCVIFEDYYRKTAITGVNCLQCGGGKKDRYWYMAYDPDIKNIRIFCSQLCCNIKMKETILLCSGCNKECNKYQRSRCSGCGVDIYCSEECQKKDWTIHKLVCKENAEKCRNNFIADNLKATCYNCFKESTKGFKQCSGCKRIAYCSETCQKAHWKREHKKQCKELQKQYPIKIE